MEEPVEFVVDEAAADRRVDIALPLLCADFSRRLVQQLCAEGQILIGKRRLKKSELVRNGERITVLARPRAYATPNPNGALDVRFESRDWVVVHKPALQPTAPRDASDHDCMANALVARYPELARVGYRPLEPGLLHRLDNGTSGLVVAARDMRSFEAARVALRNGSWVKRYLAVVTGTGLPERGTIVGALRADRRAPQRVALDGPVEVLPYQGPATNVETRRAPNDESRCDGRDRERVAPARRSPGAAVTHFVVLARLENSAYVEVDVSAAFRHQIRAHFSAAGWPLLNDETYGARRHAPLAPGRHALHAARVAWSGSVEFPGFDVEAPLPADLASALAS